MRKIGLIRVVERAEGISQQEEGRRDREEIGRSSAHFRLIAGMCAGRIRVISCAYGRANPNWRIRRRKLFGERIDRRTGRKGGRGRGHLSDAG